MTSWWIIILLISSNVIQKDAVIIVEWPFIKYIDLLNKEIVYSNPEEFVKNVEMRFRKFAQKYVDGQKVEKQFQLHIQYDPVVFKMCSYMRNIQELFILGHELGHLILWGSPENTEQAEGSQGGVLSEAAETIVNQCDTACLQLKEEADVKNLECMETETTDYIIARLKAPYIVDITQWGFLAISGGQ